MGLYVTVMWEAWKRNVRKEMLEKILEERNR